MKHTLLTASMLLALTSASLAQVTSPQLNKACMGLDNSTTEKCSCMVGKFEQALDENEKTYALAMMTLNGKLLEPLKGNLEDEKAAAVKAKIIPLMMDCVL